MLQDRGSGEPRDVNETIDFRPVPPSRRERAQREHVLAAASSDETRVERSGSDHAEQPASYDMIPRRETRGRRNVSTVTMAAGCGKRSVNETA